MLNVHKFPTLENLIVDFVDSADMLETEAWNANKLGLFEIWPEGINQGERWKVFGSRWQGKNTSNSMHLQTLRELIKLYDEAHPGPIHNAGYSLMEPGAKIAPHSGYSHDVLRLHIGLVCPEGDCQLKIGGMHQKWMKYGTILFDDTLIHEAWNNTDEERIILLMDLKKECL